MNSDKAPDAPAIAGLLEQYGCGPVQFTGTGDALYERHLAFDSVVDPAEVGPRERYEAVAHAVRDILSQRWLGTEQTYNQQNPKRVYYLSMEFLIGRSLGNNIMNLRLDAIARRFIEEEDIDAVATLEEEPDAGLGNGGLGRLAACFLNSMATMQLPAMGYGLRYEYGIFRQTIVDGWQHEQPDNWLRRPDPWEVARPQEAVEIRLGCSFRVEGGSLRAVSGNSSLLGIPYDRPVVGFGGKNINTLRLWAAAAPDAFDFQVFSAGEFVSALAERLTAESVTRVLYPDDSTSMGQGLRFIQEYFLVACSLADLVRRFHRHNSDWNALPDQIAIQLNDTHPSLAVPELMRILLDEAHLDWETAWDLTRRTLAYTNHTLLPEALEKWPRRWFETLLPRHLEIIDEIDRRLVAEVQNRFPDDEERLARVRLTEGADGDARVRMANLAIVGSHSTNGVAAIHSGLLRTVTVRELAELYPERFNNKTNGVTPRRWLLLANPGLAGCITEAIGDHWVTDLTDLAKLKPLAVDGAFRDGVRNAKRDAKQRFAAWLKSTAGIEVDSQSIFDCQVKRIHEYKRQLLNALRIVVLYNRLRENPNLDMTPRTFFFSGKAAPAYHLAKLIIKFLNNLAGTIDGDPAVRGRLKVVFLPEYCVTLAERLIPAADVSNQISTAGYEASGTSNMKFMMNGALTVGTRDGATIEMAEATGEENFFLFGLTADEVAGSRGWYSPGWHYDNEPETHAALDLIFSGHFSRNEPDIFETIRETLLTHGDYYMHLADLTSYLEADRRLLDLYADPNGWARKAILNIAGSGAFSSDRTIAEYAAEIWNAKPCSVP